MTTLEEMRRKGLLHGGSDNDPSHYPALKRSLRKTSAAALLEEERGRR
jgi:hypothetical protein